MYYKNIVEFDKEIDAYNQLFALTHILLVTCISASLLFLLKSFNSELNIPIKALKVVSFLFCLITFIVSYTGYIILKHKKNHISKYDSMNKYKKKKFLLPTEISVLFIIISFMILLLFIHKMFIPILSFLN